MEKEKEIDHYVKRIDAIKSEIQSFKDTFDKNTNRKKEIEEEKKELAENLK